MKMITRLCLFLLLPPCLHAQLSEVRLLPEDGEEAEYFGWSTTIFGEYAIIGASEDDDQGPASGSVYVFKRSGQTWIQLQKLLASDGSSYDTFGNAVAISDSFAVVGAQLDDDSGADAGALYLFRREGETWIEHEKLTADDGAPFDHFGSSVAISGNLIVAGASLDDDNGENSGSAYVFRRSGADWIQEAKLLASDGAIDDRFEEVGISDSTIIVGAWGDQDQGDLTGSAYIFTYNGAGWIQQTKLIASDQAGGDQFGIDVSISGARAIIGAHANDDNGDRSGSAYVFRRDGDLWTEEAKLLPGDGAESDEFGISVSIHGDFVLVGANVDDDNGENSGSAYLFQRDDAEWSELAKIVPSDGTPFDYFGISVALSDQCALIGAGGDDDNGFDAGAAYLFEGFALPPEPALLLAPDDGAVMSTDTVHLVWQQSFPAVDVYWIEWSSDSLFSSSTTDSTLTDTSFSLGGIQNGETIWWRVRAHNLAGWGSFSDPRTFSILITDVGDLSKTPGRFSVEQNYPNPFNPVTTIHYVLPERTHVLLKVYNGLGQEVATLVDEMQEAGDRMQEWDAAGLASGVYFYRLTTPHFVQTRKLVLLR